MEYAFAEFYVKDAFKARAGKMFVPFGIYNEIHTAKPLFLSVKEPVSTNKIEKMGSTIRFYPRWGAGLSVLGNGQLAGRDWDYTLLFANGDQRVAAANDPEYPNPFDEDDNTPKAVAVRLRFHPAREITVGASLYGDRLRLTVGAPRPRPRGEGRRPRVLDSLTALPETAVVSSRPPLSHAGQPPSSEHAQLTGQADERERSGGLARRAGPLPRRRRRQ